MNHRKPGPSAEAPTPRPSDAPGKSLKTDTPPQTSSAPHSKDARSKANAHAASAGLPWRARGPAHKDHHPVSDARSPSNEAATDASAPSPASVQGACDRLRVRAPSNA